MTGDDSAGEQRDLELWALRRHVEQHQRRLLSNKEDRQQQGRLLTTRIPGRGPQSFFR